MAEENYKRKLTAIMSADVVGYSKLMGDDESATVRTLAVYKGVMSKLIHQHRGRVVDSPGDNMLSEFASVVDAVQCAVAIQEELKSRNSELPTSRKMRFRIGINLGDVIEEGDCLYGDGVNITARLESIADPGGICISRAAFDQIETKLPLGYEYLGGQKVKNIAKPVDAYKVLMEPGKRTKRFNNIRNRVQAVSSSKIVLTCIVIVIGAIGASTLWQFYSTKNPQQTDKIDLGSSVFPPADKPSIAVLPFENMTGDSEQQYFCDGIAEQIISGLSQGPYLYVTARTSSFAFRGKSMTAQQIASKLGVRYLLEGSVQSKGELIRINAQLIDGQSGNHIWAKRYNRDSEELFVLQDEITMAVMASLNVEVTGFTTGSLRNTRPKNLEAYEYYLKGMYYHLGRRSRDIPKAHAALNEAIKLDPSFAAAHRMLGFVHMGEILRRTTKTPKETLKKAEQAAQTAFELDSDYPPYTLWSYINRVKLDTDKAIMYGQKGVALDPNNPYRYYFLGIAQFVGEQFEESKATYETALQLLPFRPANYLVWFAWTYIGLKQYDNAIALFDEIIERSPKSYFAYASYRGLAAAYELKGNHEKAKWAAENVMRINPKYSLAIEKKHTQLKKGDFQTTIWDAMERSGLK